MSDNVETYFTKNIIYSRKTRPMGGFSNIVVKLSKLLVM